MRHEPTELNLFATSKRTRQIRATNILPAADALDAAFEDYSRVDVGTDQIEPPRGPSLRGDSRSTTKELIANLTAQLDILDRQREQLASLLSGVDTSSFGH